METVWTVVWPCAQGNLAEPVQRRVVVVVQVCGPVCPCGQTRGGGGGVLATEDYFLVSSVSVGALIVMGWSVSSQRPFHWTSTPVSVKK